jgi:hypothetical protein
MARDKARRGHAIDEIGEGIYSQHAEPRRLTPERAIAGIEAHQAALNGRLNWYEEVVSGKRSRRFPHLFDERAREAAAAMMKWRAGEKPAFDRSTRPAVPGAWSNPKQQTNKQSKGPRRAELKRRIKKAIQSHVTGNGLPCRGLSIRFRLRCRIRYWLEYSAARVSIR